MNASSRTGVIPPLQVTTLSTTPIETRHACTMIKRVRRLTNSPSTPAGIPSSKNGAADAVWIRATSAASLWCSTRNHCAPTVCIQPPILLISDAVQRARNSFTRSGPSAEGACGAEGADAGEVDVFVITGRYWLEETVSATGAGVSRRRYSCSPVNTTSPFWLCTVTAVVTTPLPSTTSSDLITSWE